MSRIGRMPVTVPSGVSVQIAPGSISVKGPKGELSRALPTEITVNQNDGTLLVTRPSDAPTHRALHGLTRSLVSNMVVGVTTGFTKTLEIYGVGYRVTKNGSNLSFALGYSHPIEITPPPGIEFSNIETFTPTQANEWLSCRFSVLGINKELVGETAAKLRALRKVEPYKGKGLRYQGERVRRKAGKAAGKGKTAK